VKELPGSIIEKAAEEAKPIKVHPETDGGQEMPLVTDSTNTAKSFC